MGLVLTKLEVSASSKNAIQLLGIRPAGSSRSTLTTVINIFRELDLVLFEHVLCVATRDSKSPTLVSSIITADWQNGHAPYERPSAPAFTYRSTGSVLDADS